MKPLSSGLRHGLFVGLIIASTLAAYGGSFDVYFLKDDLSLGAMTDGQGNFSAGAFLDQFLWPTGRTWDDIWRPVPALTWALDFIIFGADPFAFHYWNILVHSLNGVLIYWLVTRVNRFRSHVPGLLAGLYFVLYPIHVEAVLWTTQRTAVFGLAFALMSVIAFDAWLHRRTRRLAILAWTCFACAALSREHAVPLPAVLCAWALLLGPPRSFSKRFRDAFFAGVVGVVLLAAYFGCRYAIFGRFTGGYSGWATQADYARDLKVFELFPQTLRMMAAPANAHLAGTPWLLGYSIAELFLGLQAAVAGVALFGFWFARKGSVPALRFSLLAVVFTVTAWLPVGYVFWIATSLLNARSSYHLTALPLALLGFLMGQLSYATTRGVLRWVMPSLLIAVYAAILQLNLLAYDEGGRQVRGLQEETIRSLDRLGDQSALVVFNVPNEARGCPTVDANLPFLVSPPFASRHRTVVPLVFGLDATWPDLLRASPTVAKLQNSRAIDFLRARGTSPYLEPLFGAPESEVGEKPPKLLSPQDPTITFTAGPPILFEVETVPEAAEVILLLDLPLRSVKARALFEKHRSADGRRFIIPIQEAILEDASSLPWPLPRELFAVDNPYPVQWRVVSQDANGRLIGVSATRRLVLVEERW